VLEVHNDGPPIPDDVRSRMFEPFATGGEAARPRGHLGLGLFIVREIAVAHGGVVDLCSTESAGTSFVVKLPRHAPATFAD
jgi:signal transduction histidine kinase